MASTLSRGDAVQTPLGKGVVREVKRSGQLVVDVGGRAVVLGPDAVAPLPHSTGRTKRKATPETSPDPADVGEDDRGRAPAEIDLHGLTIEAAMARVEEAINDAILEDRATLRVIHGQSGGRIRAALHRWLRNTPSVRGFDVDPRNPGVTIVRF